MKKYVYCQSSVGAWSVYELDSNGQLGKNIAVFKFKKDAIHFASFKEYFDLEEIK